jgi:hypothetical protein
LGRSFVRDGRFFVEDGRVVDPVEDQQRRDDAEDRDQRVTGIEVLRTAFMRCSAATASVITRTMGMKSSASQALCPGPAPLTAKRRDEVFTALTPNQWKNIKAKSRIAEMLEILSPILSRRRLITLQS